MKIFEQMHQLEPRVKLFHNNYSIVQNIYILILTDVYLGVHRFATDVSLSLQYKFAYAHYCVYFRLRPSNFW